FGQSKTAMAGACATADAEGRQGAEALPLSMVNWSRVAPLPRPCDSDQFDNLPFEHGCDGFRIHVRSSGMEQGGIYQVDVAFGVVPETADRLDPGASGRV